MTFSEYLTKQATTHIKEKVDYQGKSKKESGNYSWSEKQTRIAFLVDNYMAKNIEKAISGGLIDENEKKEKRAWEQEQIFM